MLLALVGGMLYALCRARLASIEAKGLNTLKAREAARGDEGNVGAGVPRWRRLLTAALDATLFARLDTWYYADNLAERTRLLRKEINLKVSRHVTVTRLLNDCCTIVT